MLAKLRSFFDDSKKQAGFLVKILWSLLTIFGLYAIIVSFLWVWVNWYQAPKVYPETETIFTFSGEAEISISYPHYILAGEKYTLNIQTIFPSASSNNEDDSSSEKPVITVEVPGSISAIKPIDEEAESITYTIEEFGEGKEHSEKIELLVAPDQLDWIGKSEEIKITPSIAGEEELHQAAILVEGKLASLARVIIQSQGESGLSTALVAAMASLLGVFLTTLFQRSQSDEAQALALENERVADFRTFLKEDPLLTIESLYRDDKTQAENEAVTGKYFDRCQELIRNSPWEKTLSKAVFDALDAGNFSKTARMAAYMNRIDPTNMKAKAISQLIKFLNPSNQKSGSGKETASENTTHLLAQLLEFFPVRAKPYVVQGALQTREWENIKSIFLIPGEKEDLSIQEAISFLKKTKYGLDLTKEALKEDKEKNKDKLKKIKDAENDVNIVLRFLGERIILTEIDLFWKDLPSFDDNIPFKSWLVLNGFFLERRATGNQPYHPFFSEQAEFDSLLGELPIVNHPAFKVMMTPQPTMVCGQTGAGKTAAAFHLVKECQQRGILPIYLPIQVGIPLKNWLSDRIIAFFVDFIKKYPKVFLQAEREQKTYYLNLVRNNPHALQEVLANLEAIEKTSDSLAEYEWTKKLVDDIFSEAEKKEERPSQSLDLFHLARLLKFIRLPGYGRIYLILDFASWGDFANQENLILNLKQIVQVFSEYDMIVKVFAPIELREPLSDLFSDSQIGLLEWDDVLLKDFLHKRRFECGKLSDLGLKLLDPEDWLIDKCDTPRQLIKRGKRLLNLVEKQADDSYKFSKNDFEECLGENPVAAHRQD